GVAHVRESRAGSDVRGAWLGPAIGQLANPGLSRAVGAAEVLPPRLQPLADDRDPAMAAARGDQLDRALEGVDDVRRSTHRDLEGLVVGVPAGFAARHVRVPVMLVRTDTSLVPAGEARFHAEADMCGAVVRPRAHGTG